MARPKVLHADGVVPGDAAAIVDGAVVLDEGGLVLEVGCADEVLPRHAGAAVERVRGAILPGLVNAHTHLELSALRGHVPGGAGFVAWVERLIGARAEMSSEDAEVAIDRAVLELEATGTAAVGEVTNTLGAAPALARAGFAGCLFHEVFGVLRDGVMRRVRALLEDVDEKLGRWSAPRLSYALAPHTLYTTHPDAVRAIADFSRARGRRTSLHLAEHAAERRALVHGDGPVVKWLEARAKSTPEWPGKGPIDYAFDLGIVGPNALLVHLADAKDDELERLARAEAHVVLCPRSNLFIETCLPPLLAMRAHGIAPALGTDSLASSPSLDVLAEARALADRFSQVPARELVQMATWNGARALGLADLGRIAQGARPGVVAIDGDLGGAEPCAWVLRQVKAPRRWVSAKRVHP